MLPKTIESRIQEAKEILKEEGQRWYAHEIHVQRKCIHRPIVVCKKYKISKKYSLEHRHDLYNILYGFDKNFQSHNTP
jgi:hypothetical protein